MMLFWSTASVLHALSTGAASLLICRFLLGLREGGAFPTDVRAVAERFPRRERATLWVGPDNLFLFTHVEQ